MGNRLRSSLVGLVLILVLPSTTFAQRATFDPHDLSGVWGATNVGPRRSFSGEQVAPMTAWGKQQYDAHRPSYGPRAVAPALGNDPTGDCNPLGVPRILLFDRPMEFMPGPSRMMQIFEWTHAWREIWTDGRELPKDPDPRWMGYSVGRWEGDTFVVNSSGFDDRTWLDQYGNPHSDQMTVEERWRRVDRDTLELNMKLVDPKTYLNPVVAEKKVFKVVRRDEQTFDGWYSLREEFCAPVNEQSFNERVRNPAGGKLSR